MKYLPLLALLFLGACNLSETSPKSTGGASDSAMRAAMNDTANYTTIEWLDSTHTVFSENIVEGQQVQLNWRFKNTGDKPLIVEDVHGTCGCTVGEKPTKPIAPGETGEIKATFNSDGQSATFEKKVSVTANTKPSQSHELIFSGHIVKKA